MRSLLIGSLVFLLLISIIPRPALAEEATFQEMELVCNNFLDRTVQNMGAWAETAKPRITSVQDVMMDGQLLGRCFNIAPKGFVIVPVLKELPPIKAHSDTCNMDVNSAGGMPQLIKEVLHHRINLYIDRFGSIGASQPPDQDVLLDRVHGEEWDNLLDFELAPNSILNRKKSSTLPEFLLETSWHQYATYNAFCPKIQVSPGVWGQCLVGCLATGMAQIMQYWKWPVQGVGSHAYMWDPVVMPPRMLIASFNDIYDWSGNSPFEICVDVGKALDMNYGLTQSVPYGDWVKNVKKRIPENFRYQNIIKEEYRKSYAFWQDWSEMIRKEIQDGRPMLYYIQLSRDSAHIVVCDGWTDLYGPPQYHINYGYQDIGYNLWYSIDGIQGSYYPQKNEFLLRQIVPKNIYIEIPPQGP